MLGKTSKPVIEILSGSLVPGAGSPRSQIQSPRGLKSLDLGGVGLGIVAALEKSGGMDGIPALFGRNLTRSSPIPVNSPKDCSRSRREVEEMEMDSLEEYTIVTCHGPNKSYTKVYSDAAEGGRKGNERAPFRIGSSNKKSNRATVFQISSVRGADAGGVPPPDFLSSCDLCHKKLHGKDIYMYRGEKAFCSSECRYRQIVMDERKEKCSAEASKQSTAATASVEVAGSPYGNGQMFTTGILAI